MKNQLNISSINLGCTKNLVDTQFLLGKIFEENSETINYFIDPYDKSVEYVILNTCGFISSGRQEMLDTIKQLLDKKKKIILIGCGMIYYKSLDTSSTPKILENKDIINVSWKDLGKNLNEILKSKNKITTQYNFPNSPRAYTNIEYGFEYLKIAEGCNNSCSFCIIPDIRGKQKSLETESITTEIKQMISMGIKEIILIAQDTTRYGADLYGKPSLFELLEKIDKIPGDFMYRVLYLYPDIITLKQLEKLTKLKKFIPYFDIPLQHISSNILKRMKRFYDEKYIFKFLDFINQNFKQKFIRTNIIVGFPGETDEDFDKLLDFVKNQDFDNISLFEYHDEPLSESSKLDHKVPYTTIHSRFLELKKLVDQKLKQKGKSRKGIEKTGFVMDIKNKSKIIVRNWLHSPEIDSYDEISIKQIIGVYNESGEINIGEKIIYIL